MALNPKPTRCAFVSAGGPTSDWDIKRYASGLQYMSGVDIKLIGNATEQPPTMVPFGRTSAGAGCDMLAHPACYRLLLGVVGAAREDPERAAAFEREHPSQRYAPAGSGRRGDSSADCTRVR